MLSPGAGAGSGMSPTASSFSHASYQTALSEAWRGDGPRDDGKEEEEEEEEEDDMGYSQWTGGDEMREVLFPAVAAMQSRWSLATSLNDSPVENSRSTTKEKRGRKEGRRRRLVNFIARLSGAAGGGRGQQEEVGRMSSPPVPTHPYAYEPGEEGDAAIEENDAVGALPATIPPGLRLEVIVPPEATRFSILDGDGFGQSDDMDDVPGADEGKIFFFRHDLLHMC